MELDLQLSARHAELQNRADLLTSAASTDSTALLRLQRLCLEIEFALKSKFDDILGHETRLSAEFGRI